MRVQLSSIERWSGVGKQVGESASQRVGLKVPICSGRFTEWDEW